MSTALGLSLSLPNRTQSCETARDAVLRLLAPYSLDEQVMFNVELILEETLMNVIWHAFDDEQEHMIDFQVQVTPENVHLHFEDEGREFDPTQAPEPKLPTDIEDAVPGGLGVMLVRKFAKEVRYQRRNGRNLLDILVARAP